MTFSTLYLTMVVASFTVFALTMGGVGIWCAMAKAPARP